MNYGKALSLLFRHRPYFLGATHGRQASILQHLVMTGIVSFTAKERQRIRVLEIGSWIGFSALTWAHSVDKFAAQGGEVVCVDSWEPYFAPDDIQTGQSIYVDMDEMLRIGLAYDLFRHNVGFAPQRCPVAGLKGKSAEILAGLPDASFDVVYIDASHYHDDVRSDIDHAHRLAGEDGIICGDDLELQLGQISESVVRGNLNRDFLKDEASGRVYHPGVTLAVGERYGPVQAIDGCWFGRKTGAGLQPFDPLGGAVLIPPHFTPEMRQQAEKIITPVPAPGD